MCGHCTHLDSVIWGYFEAHALAVLRQMLVVGAALADASGYLYLLHGQFN